MPKALVNIRPEVHVAVRHICIERGLTMGRLIEDALLLLLAREGIVVKESVFNASTDRPSPTGRRARTG